MAEEFILGTQGWKIRGHDASAAIIKCHDGKVDIIAAAEEERFTGLKHAYDTLPNHSIEFCLREAGIKAEDLSAIAIPFQYQKMYEERGINFNLCDKGVISAFMPQLAPQNMPDLFYVNHHLAHAISAFAPAMVDSSTVLIVDGQGERESTSVWAIKELGKSVKKIASSDIGSSLGYFYEGLTEFVGFRGDEAGKTMGLAPYGNPNRYRKHLEKLISIENCVISVNGSSVKLGLQSGDYLPVDEQWQVRSFWIKQLSNITGLKQNDNSRKYSYRNFPRPYADVASAGQLILENILVSLALQSKEATGLDNLSIAGGVGLNCVANGKIAELSAFRNFYIQPASNDAGTSLGAALEIARQKGYRISHVPMSAYQGIGYSNDSIERILNYSEISYSVHEDASHLIADLVTRGKVVGLFQGRAEFGPRALGNRSFIADPRRREMQDYINQHVKDREEGRPLAPSVIDRDAEIYFDRMRDAPHMTIASRMKKSLGAVTHVDGTTRPQIVDAGSNALYYNQLEKIKERLGEGAVVNTSLNLSGPIVNTPHQALKLLESTGTVAIIFNNRYVVMKNE